MRSPVRRTYAAHLTFRLWPPAIAFSADQVGDLDEPDPMPELDEDGHGYL